MGTGSTVLGSGAVDGSAAAGAGTAADGAARAAASGASEAAGAGDASRTYTGSAQAGLNGRAGSDASGAAGAGAATGAMTDGVGSGDAAGAAAGRSSLAGFREVPELGDIHFDYDAYVVRPVDTATLDASARWLRSNPKHVVLIEGHCDERGTQEYNLALGAHRAKSTMTYLVSQGVEPHRIQLISYGKERPICSEDSDACWSRNRRARFLVKPE
jgi:peptidoglycan-associated lipoprotein